MKNILLIFAMFFTLSATAQGVRTFSPTGNRISDPVPVIMNGTVTPATLFADSIAANTLILGKYYQFRLDLTITTPLINVGTITITLKYGNATLVVANASVLVGSLTNAPVIITGTIVGRGTNAQYVAMNVSQPQGNAINLTTGNSIMQGTMATDATIAQPVTVVAQLGGTVSGTIITRQWALKLDF